MVVAKKVGVGGRASAGSRGGGKPRKYGTGTPKPTPKGRANPGYGTKTTKPKPVAQSGKKLGGKGKPSQFGKEFRKEIGYYTEIGDWFGARDRNRIKNIKKKK